MLLHRKILVSGIVQGVGFRPFCARLAEKFKVDGSVKNTSGGVRLDLYGGREALDQYEAALAAENPPASVVTSVAVIENSPMEGPAAAGFVILESEREEVQSVLIPPDLAVCPDCLAEMNDPSDRRYRYPFINCTNCGPRYTIIKALPYDRPKTAMASFAMCPACEREYRDPSDRRFHAQPDACFDCGPSVWLADSRGGVLCRGDEAVRTCSSLLDEGNIAAIKGIGGFHIACSPFEDRAVELLRERKKRRSKPLAVMASSMEEAARLAYIPVAAKELLESPRKPIVLCCKRKDYPLSPLVAPGQKTVGIMLPYSPLHHLILQGKRALVMTSANFSDEPIVSSNDKALAALGGIADFLLLHDREIYMAIDDSVAAPTGRSYFLMRRARGYTPAPMAVKDSLPVILGAGAEMKASFCISRGNFLFPGQYLGDMKQRETAVYYGRALEHMTRLYELTPEYLACDLHPQFLSTAAALKFQPVFNGGRVAVQHHHAHLAACLLENGREGPVLGAIFDGTGYGPDGTIWGGEFLAGDASDYTRAGCFLPCPLPGGDKAVLEPWRFALSLLAATFGGDEALRLVGELWPGRKDQSPLIIKTLPHSPITTSCGRFFDGAASLLGLCEEASFDGEAAMALEGIAMGGSLEAPFGLKWDNGVLVLDWRPAVRWLVENKKGISAELLAGAVHTGLARATARACGLLSEKTGLMEIVLSGGVWQNRRLLAFTRRFLGEMGITSLVHRLLPPNDECVSAGQVAAAGEILRRGR
ncbi:MAG: carbamoyltransferase HypF [Aminivibrio sp.]|jgi:hydrogenase maturation protein HypF